MTKAEIDNGMVVEALRMGTATLYEASGYDCALDPGIRPVWSGDGASVAGRAYTVRCHPADNLPIHHALERASKGDFLVIDCGGVLAGYWGEVLTEAAQARGIVGLIIDGGVRDVAEMTAMKFPVYSRGICIRRTSKHAAGIVGKPITIAGQYVSTGDLIVADIDGVIALPPEKVSATLEASEKRLAREVDIIGKLREGASTTELYGLAKRDRA